VLNHHNASNRTASVPLIVQVWLFAAVSVLLTLLAIDRAAEAAPPDKLSVSSHRSVPTWLKPPPIQQPNRVSSAYRPVGYVAALSVLLRPCHRSCAEAAAGQDKAVRVRATIRLPTWLKPPPCQQPNRRQFRLSSSIGYVAAVSVLLRPAIDRPLRLPPADKAVRVRATDQVAHVAEAPPMQNRTGRQFRLSSRYCYLPPVSVFSRPAIDCAAEAAAGQDKAVGRATDQVATLQKPPTIPLPNRVSSLIVQYCYVPPVSVCSLLPSILP